jgi:hypothetical protein
MAANKEEPHERGRAYKIVTAEKSIKIFAYHGNTFAFGDQGALFEKTAPWTVKHPQKLLINFIVSG